MKNPLQKIGRKGNLVESDNETLRPSYGCQVKKCESNQIPDKGACLVLATHPEVQDGHCFLFKDGELDWDPSLTVSTWPNSWEISEVWKIESLPAEMSETNDD